ncbi:MAG: L-serine ammonia-lyase, partial [Acidimicrobiales bacterium]
MVLGLLGFEPATLDPDSAKGLVAAVRRDEQVTLATGTVVGLRPDSDLVFHKRSRLPHHSNGMRFTLLDADGVEQVSKDYYSVGGGFVVNADQAAGDQIVADATPLPLHFRSGDELLRLCEEHGLTIAELMMRNEDAWRPRAETVDGLLEIWSAMQACVERGISNDGFLPGALGVRRRAPAMAVELRTKVEAAMHDPLTTLDWVSLYALAVNEENAAGGRVVTAPTNGAAGVVPAVLHYYRRFIPGATDEGVIEFLLTAAAIGILFKENASISGAEVGCQGEVGVACSMAAAGLAAVRG